MKKILCDERGSIVILSALMIIAVVAATALAVDGGYLYFTHTKFQDLADAAALSAAIEIGNGKANLSNSKKEENGFEEAIRCITENGLQVKSRKNCTAEIVNRADETGLMTVIYYPPDPQKTSDVERVQVELKIEANTFFAKVLGKFGSPLKVDATSKIGQVTRISQLTPLSFFWDNYECGHRYDISLSPVGGGSQNGNCGYLDFEGKGTDSQFADYLINGYDGTLRVDQWVPTYTGVNTGQLDTGINENRLKLCDDTCFENVKDCVYGDYDDNCPRVVIIPIIKNFFTSSGKTEVQIGGFAKFYIEGYNKSSKVLSGYFILAIEDASEIDGSALKYMISGVKLIE